VRADRSSDSWDEVGALQERLLGSKVFENVPPQLVYAAVAGSETRELSRQEVLLRAGTRNDELYVVISGRLSVHVPGAEQPHVRLGAGECVGELSFLDGHDVSADVIADEPTLVLALDPDQLWPLIDSSAEVARNLLRILAGRVRGDVAALAESGRQQRQLEHVATVDGLTGLRNRRWLDDAFARQVARAARTGQALSVLMIDVDHFKRLNDEHGHRAGDVVLRDVAQTLASGLRPVDLLARYGGEEFAVLLPGLGSQTAIAVAERLRQAVEAGRAQDRPGATVSVGVASLCADESLPAILGRADAALYRAKQSGRNRTSA